MPYPNFQLTAAAGVKTRLIGAGGGADRLTRLLGGNADIALFRSGLSKT